MLQILFQEQYPSFFLLAPADESQIVYGQRRLQVGQDVVRGAQIDGEADYLAATWV